MCAVIVITTIAQSKVVILGTAIKCTGPNNGRVAVVSPILTCVTPGGALALVPARVAPHRAWHVASVVVVVTKLQTAFVYFGTCFQLQTQRCVSQCWKHYANNDARTEKATVPGQEFET